MRIAWDNGTFSDNTVNCMGMNSSGAPVNRYGAAAFLGDAGTLQVFTDAQAVVYATCSFGNSSNAQHVTQVTLQRRDGDYSWVGTVTSSYNQ